MAASSEHTCGVRDDAGERHLYCWGRGLTEEGWEIRAVGTETDWATVETATPSVACAIKDDHSLWCWGDGSLGFPRTQARELLPKRVGDANDWQSLHAARDFTCAGKVDGSLFCFGGNNLGQLGNGRGALPVEVPPP